MTLFTEILKNANNILFNILSLKKNQLKYFKKKYFSNKKKFVCLKICKFYCNGLNRNVVHDNI